VDHLGPACDLYSLGVILYELLTGRPPFAAPEIEALLQEVLRQPPPPPRRLRPDLDPRLEAVVLRALAKDPVDRFASMAAFAATLAPFRPGAAPPAATLPHPPADDDWTTVNDLAVRLRPAFRHAAYPAGQPADAACLLELEVRAVTPARVPADLYLVLDVSLSMDTEQGYPLLRQAVRHLLHQLAPSAADRVGVAVFSAGADLLSPAVPAAELAEGDRLLRRMDASDMKFRAATLLAPGLRRVLDAVRAGGPDPQRVRRVYVLTDGEIHDGAACRPVLAKYRDLGLEVHVYGFGTGFDPVALKELVADQRGGTVKPICHERDLVRTFGHIAAVNQRLAAREGAVVVTFPAAVRAGDAWTFQPKQRWLGAVRQQRLVWEIGALEAGRVYALCFEAALPACGGPTAVAQARLTWQAAAGAGELVAEIAVPRAAGLGPQNDRVARAYDVLDALRRPQDAQAQARASQSELDLALEDGADPALIDALEKRSRVLSGLQPVSALSESDLKVLASDREDGWARPTVRVAAPALFGPKDEEYFANDPSPQLGISPVAQLKDYRQFKAFDVGSPVLPALDRLLAVLEGRAALPTLRGDDLEVLRPLEAYVGALDAVVVFWPAAVKDVPSLIGQLKEFRDWRAAQGTTADHLAALDKLLQVMTWHAPATLLTKADLDRLGGLRDLAVNPAFYASDDYVRTFKVAR
jgi:Mg-chelatase subunit ChlD